MPVEPGFRYRRSAVTEARHGQRRVVSLRRTPRRKLVVTLVVILVLVPAGLLALRSLWDSVTGAVPDPELGEVPTSAPRAPKLDPSNPFDQTPAERLTAPATGITLPPAAKTGGWAPKDVQTVLDRTKQILIIGRTAPAVLAGDPTTYLQSLAPNARKPAKDSISTGSDALGYVTRLAPGYRLSTGARAAGTLTVKPGDSGQLVVTADIVWVYPLSGPLTEDASGAGTRLVVLHTVETYEWYPSKRYSPADQGARPGAGEWKVFNADCRRYHTGQLALSATGAVRDPYRGRDAVFAPTTSLAEFPTSC